MANWLADYQKIVRVAGRPAGPRRATRANGAVVREAGLSFHSEMQKMQVRKDEVQFRVTQDGAFHKGFWQRVSKGRWEPGTFAVLDEHLTADTTFVDVGAWVGPTTLYAAQKSKRVLAFEPDPVAFDMLKENVEANQTAQNVELFNACVSTDGKPVRIGFPKHPGDSESSILLGNLEGSWEAASVRLPEIFEEKQVCDPIFVKIDVEGYEFELVPEVAEFLASREAVIHLSTHFNVFAGGDLAKRWRLTRASSRMAWALRHFSQVLDNKGHRVNLAASVPRAALTGHGFLTDLTIIS